MSKAIRRRFRIMAASMHPYPGRLDFRELENFTDDALAYVLLNVRGVGMLDLDGTDIGNSSISYLAGLEYVHELRLKECIRVDNGCVNDLSRMRGLRLLHVKDTGITVEGLLQLNGLRDLEELIFSVNDLVGIEGQMLELRSHFPGCKFIVNGRHWRFEGV